MLLAFKMISLLFITVVPVFAPYIPILYSPFTLITPSFWIVPVVGSVVLSPMYPAAIPTPYSSFVLSEPPIVIVAVFLAIPPLVT